jgi:hypothetical protein
MISAPVASVRPRYRPWLEVSLLVHVSSPDWGLSETEWLHWALPERAQAPDLGAARRFDPGRRSATPGAPDHAARIAEIDVDPQSAASLTQSLVDALDIEVHRQAELGLVSALGETREGFRRRCLRRLASAIGSATGSREARAANLAAVASSIETRTLRVSDLDVVRARCRISWYPGSLEPGLDLVDMMTGGPVRERHR